VLLSHFLSCGQKKAEGAGMDASFRKASLSFYFSSSIMYFYDVPLQLHVSLLAYIFIHKVKLTPKIPQNPKWVVDT
jgi:hypothetical protein